MKLVSLVEVVKPNNYKYHVLLLFLLQVCKLMYAHALRAAESLSFEDKEQLEQWMWVSMSACTRRYFYEYFIAWNLSVKLLWNKFQSHIKTHRLAMASYSSLLSKKRRFVLRIAGNRGMVHEFWNRLCTNLSLSISNLGKQSDRILFFGKTDMFHFHNNAVCNSSSRVIIRLLA